MLSHEIRLPDFHLSAGALFAESNPDTALDGILLQVAEHRLISRHTGAVIRGGATPPLVLLPAHTPVANCPVTAAEIRAARRSRARSMERWAVAIAASIFAVAKPRS